MPKILCFIAICAVEILLQPGTTLADHDMTCHPEGPSVPPLDLKASSLFGLSNVAFGVGEVLNLNVASVGGATSTSCSSAGGDALPVALPADLISAIEHIPGAGEAGRYWLLEPISQSFIDAHIGLAAELPNFTTPDGTPLLTQYRETSLDFVLSTARTFTSGEPFSVSSGQIDGWLGATLLEMPASFTLDELLDADPSRFPAYSGPAVVADIGTFRIVPEPASVALLVLAGLRLLNRRARYGAAGGGDNSNGHGRQ